MIKKFVKHRKSKTPDEKNIFLKKISKNKVIQKAFESVMKKYTPALKKLAEN